MTEYFTSDLSQELKAARLAKGYSLDQLAEITKIQPKFLRAIEDNDEDSLPEQFYARAFAKQYAKAVGLNPDEFFEEADFDPQIINDLSHAHRDDDGVVRAGTNTTMTFKSKFRGWIPKIWLLIILAVGLFLAWFVVTRVSSGSNQSGSNSQVEVTSSSVPQSSSSAASSSSNKNALTMGTAQTNVAQLTTTYNVASQLTNDHKLLVKAQNGGTTLKVTDGTGKVLYNAWMNQNTEQTIDLPANTPIINIQLSQVSHADLTLNDSQHVDIPNLPTNPAATTWNVVLNFNK
ncbi:helix-turn-helix domain-containing protein [Fructobacillus ficulneus]|uniref:Putative transcriptional regulator n=1 Tax=Fructobacillus ficulneus TaxID=157463 RepID=A0A0K8MHJ6_9LACO|nr:helix-turn-helix domain-containing protein [Fructobacillus ficulneus]GAP00011.1 putative transcriptional regulator [Fructobacillus ficulneus]